MLIALYLLIPDSVLQCLVGNIRDQNNEDSLVHKLGAFNLGTTEGLISRLEKISSLYEIFGVDIQHGIEKKW